MSSPAIEKLTAWFEAQIGTREAGENNVIYNTHFYGHPVTGSAYPWCVVFIWDGFRENGLSGLFCGGEKTAYCPYVVDWAKRHDRWITSGYREGDLLLYDWNGDGEADHIGYCVSISAYSDSLVVIEGNYQDGVGKVLRRPGAVMGAYRPEYPETLPAAPDNPTAEPDGLYTVQKGDTLWGLAERFLGNGVRFSEIMEANGLISYDIYEGDKLHIPGAHTPVMATITITIMESTLQELQRRTEGKSIGEYLDSLFAREL